MKFFTSHWLLFAASFWMMIVSSGLAYGQTTDTINLGRGDVTVHVPSSYDPSVATGVIMTLHGYTFTGNYMESYLQLLPRAEEHGFIYLYPDGTVDNLGWRYWNATDACCDFDQSGVDDVGYLTAILDTISNNYNVDPLKVHLVGHSNGGFMAHRLACENPDRFASIVSFAGATFDNPIDCTGVGPVHILQIHGTLDPIISYYGGFLEASYPSAMETCVSWVNRNGCNSTPVTGSNINLDGLLFGNETTVQRWENGCDPNGSVELWSIILGGHLPAQSSQMSDLIFQHLLDHPKLPTGPAPGFLRGDVNGDLGLDLSDAVSILVHLFNSGTIGCREAGNCNSDSSLDVSDAVYLLGYLFGAGAAPGEPFSECAIQPMWLDCLSPIDCP